MSAFQLKSKGKAAGLLMRQVSWVEQKFGRKLKKIVSHVEREYVNSLKDLEQCGFRIHPNVLYTP